jgi:gliding motility-associated-like protein
LEFLDDIYSVCNSTLDSIAIKVTNSKPGFATNVAIEFKSEGTLPALGNIILPVLDGNSDTTIIIWLPENTGTTAQTGSIKAEIVSCDQSDANPLTHYGDWRDERDWTGEPLEADEDMLELTIYPDMRITSKLEDTVCSGETFIYDPQSNIPGTEFSWERLADLGIDYEQGTGAINEVLVNDLESPITVQYVFKLEADFCTSSIIDTVTVVVYPNLPLTLSHYPADGLIMLGTPITIVSQTTQNIHVRYRYTIVNSAVNPLIYQDDSDGGEHEYKLYEFNDGEENTVEVTLENDYGCVVRGIETFSVTYNLPNVITPKALTNNKLFPSYEGQEVKFDIQVFNRLGSELYRGTDGWDGTYRGELVASGTYFYVLRYTQPNGKVMEIKQSVFVKY